MIHSLLAELSLRFSYRSVITEENIRKLLRAYPRWIRGHQLLGEILQSQGEAPAPEELPELCNEAIRRLSSP